MQTNTKDQKKFTKVGITIIVLLVAAVFGVGYVLAKQNSDKDEAQSTSARLSTSKTSGKALVAKPALATLASTYTDPDKHRIAVLLAEQCEKNGEQELINIAKDEKKFIVRGYFAKVTVACEGGGFVGYLEKMDAKDPNSWTVLERTQQTPNCKYYDNEAGLSHDIVDTCYDENTLKERPINT